MRVSGTIRVPGDKSISHRSLILGALASGSSRVRGILESADVHSTAGALRALGVGIPPLSPEMSITGVGLHGLREGRGALDCGNSGTTARLMSGVVAALPFATRFIGDPSLSRRPMRRVAAPLEAMGARFEFGGPRDRLPMTVHGAALQSISWTTETASAQVKSAILLAGLVGEVAVTVTEPSLSRDHTERMLEALGARIERSMDGEEHRVTLQPPEALPGAEFDVPGDPSSAAFFAALAALATAGEIVLRDVMVNPTRAGFLQILQAMGASVLEDLPEGEGMAAGEQVTTVRVRPHELRGVTVTAAQVPSMIDELPLLACVATRATGETVITGAGELRVKESDRITVVVENLQSIGAQAEQLPDGMRIVGGTEPLRGTVRTHGDHRIAMAFGVLGALDGNDIRVDDPACVGVSYPDFWTDLQRVIR